MKLTLLISTIAICMYAIIIAIDANDNLIPIELDVSHDGNVDRNYYGYRYNVRKEMERRRLAKEMEGEVVENSLRGVNEQVNSMAQMVEKLDLALHNCRTNMGKFRNKLGIIPKPILTRPEGHGQGQGEHDPNHPGHDEHDPNHPGHGDSEEEHGPEHGEPGHIHHEHEDLGDDIYDTIHDLQEDNGRKEIKIGQLQDEINQCGDRIGALDTELQTTKTENLKLMDALRAAHATIGALEQQIRAISAEIGERKEEIQKLATEQNWTTQPNFIKDTIPDNINSMVGILIDRIGVVESKREREAIAYEKQKRALEEQLSQPLQPAESLVFN